MTGRGLAVLSAIAVALWNMGVWGWKLLDDQRHRAPIVKQVHMERDGILQSRFPENEEQRLEDQQFVGEMAESAISERMAPHEEESTGIAVQRSLIGSFAVAAIAALGVVARKVK